MGLIKYQITLMVDDGWYPQKYHPFSLDEEDDALAKATCINHANQYIRSGESPRLISAHVSRWVQLSPSSGGYWLTVAHVKRGVDLLMEDVTSCLTCNGTGKMMPRK